MPSSRPASPSHRPCRSDTVRCAPITARSRRKCQLRVEPAHSHGRRVLRLTGEAERLGLAQWFQRVHPGFVDAQQAGADVRPVVGSATAAQRAIAVRLAQEPSGPIGWTWHSGPPARTAARLRLPSVVLSARRRPVPSKSTGAVRGSARRARRADRERAHRRDCTHLGCVPSKGC